MPLPLRVENLALYQYLRQFRALSGEYHHPSVFSSTSSPVSACPFFSLLPQYGFCWKGSYSLHDAPSNGPYFFTLKFIYVFLDFNTSAISLLQNTFMYDISLSFYLISMAFSLLFHPLSWLLILYLLDFFFLSTHYLEAFIHFYGLKYHLSADNSQIYIFEIACPSKLQLPTSNFLRYISICMSHSISNLTLLKLKPSTINVSIPFPIMYLSP